MEKYQIELLLEMVEEEITFQSIWNPKSILIHWTNGVFVWDYLMG